MVRIALLGTRGVPARYGGFETCVEEVGARLARKGHDVLVFCRRTSGEPPRATHRGMRLVSLPAIPKRSLETLSHTAISVLSRSLTEIDAAIVFNAANAIFLPVLSARRIPAATHVDGLEWMRAKWGTLGRRYYRLAEALAVRWSAELIADAAGIASYYRREFDAPTTLIAYGAPIITPDSAERIEELGLQPRKYHLLVARFEPENHVLEIVKGYRQSSAVLPLVVVGSAPYSDEYTGRVRAAADSRVQFLGGIWDQELLDELYAHALTYLHGHSVGGTNPSLLRAAGAGTYTIAYDVSFNREVLADSGAYFLTSAEVADKIMTAERRAEWIVAEGTRLQQAVSRYNWDDVADRYEECCLRLASRRFSEHRPSGRRARFPDAGVVNRLSDCRRSAPEG